MSHENVEGYRAQFDAIRRGDWDVYAANLDADVVVRTDPGWPEQRIYGRKAVTAWARGALESLGPDFRIEEIVDLGDRVLARWCWNTRGQHSGIGGELHYSEIVTFREGRAILIEHFRDHDQALKAVGLAGYAMLAKVEIARRGIDAFNRRDVDALDDLTTPDVEWFPALPSTVEGEGYRGYRGREGIEACFDDIRSTWEALRVLGDELRDLGDCVLVLGRIEGRGLGSGVEVDTPWGAIFDFRDEKMSRARAYLDHGEALRAAGLSKSSGQAGA